jgi:cation-transporting ATPase E
MIPDLVAHEQGLSEAEASQRALAGQANVDSVRQRSDGDVIRKNTLTFFNVMLAALIGALLLAGELRDGLFVGAVVIANVLIATLQELSATRRLRELRALAAPRATVVRDGQERLIPAQEVVLGDLLHLLPGDEVVVDGRVTREAAEIDESLLTGEPVPTRRAAGDELKAGSFCAAGDCYYRAERVGTASYAAELAAQARELVVRSSPLMLRFRRLLRVLLTATGILSVVLFIQFNVLDRGFVEALKATTAIVTTVVPVGLLLAMTVVTSVGALRVSQAGAVVQDIDAVEALNYVDVIALDKTGTITSNRLSLEEMVWAADELAWKPWIAAYAHATATDSKTADALDKGLAGAPMQVGERIPFSSDRRWSAAELRQQSDCRVLLLGSPEAMLQQAGAVTSALLAAYERARKSGRRGVVFATAPALPEVDRPLGNVQPLALAILCDELRPEAREAFVRMAELGITPKVISGDHAETVSALLARLEVPEASKAVAGSNLADADDATLERAVAEYTVFGRVTPALKGRLVEALKRRGHFVAMVGDGTNDVLGLRAADVPVAMASGTAAARAVSSIVLLEDSFTALIRGTREATFVLGNIARLSKLFIAKSVYTYLLILATNMLGLGFPFLPRQGGVVFLLTLGIPALFIAVSQPPRRVQVDFSREVLAFALPAGLGLAAVTILVQFVVEGLLSRPVEEARTFVSMTLVTAGLAFVVEVFGMEAADFRRPWRLLLSLTIASMCFVVLLLTIGNELLRSFFAFTPVSTLAWTLVLAATGAALVIQFCLTRYWRALLNFLIAKPTASQVPRGRSA